MAIDAAAQIPLWGGEPREFAQFKFRPSDLAVTLNETLIGFAVGVSIAMALGALFAYVPILRMAAYTNRCPSNCECVCGSPDSASSAPLRS